ncbi:hypothetical protein JTE90_011762 [Oedothorax gibbosus]|uniref:Secreted protein n=1 Tax=Oedothorax gibbosus TaxID=931172 RepID=A0AAV6VRN4_9ARAC|nr:hypothetical protein JTE90_011762 [Oedothorax gibbosus]
MSLMVKNIKYIIITKTVLGVANSAHFVPKVAPCSSDPIARPDDKWRVYCSAPGRTTKGGNGMRKRCGGLCVGCWKDVCCTFLKRGEEDLKKSYSTHKRSRPDFSSLVFNQAKVLITNLLLPRTYKLKYVTGHTEPGLYSTRTSCNHLSTPCLHRSACPATICARGEKSGIPTSAAFLTSLAPSQKEGYFIASPPSSLQTSRLADQTGETRLLKNS